MFVTNLIKDKEIKDIILKTFPKKINKNIITPKIKHFNTNPSLTGNAFELFFEIYQCKSFKSLQDLIQNKSITAEKNISAIKKQKEKIGIIDKNSIYIYLSKKDFTHLCKILSQSPNSNSYLKLKQDTVNFLRLQASYDLNIFTEINKNTDLLLYPFNGVSEFIIIEKESLINFYKKVLQKIYIEGSEFLNGKIADKKFSKTILQFSHISHQFFSFSKPLRNISIEPNYLNYVHFLFRNLSSEFSKIKATIVVKPKLHEAKILATPDYLINNTIVEIKTSKKYFSTNDYLQVMFYLIFAQSKENKKEYGNIKKAILYYPLYNKILKFDINGYEFDLNKLMTLIKKRAKKVEIFK